MLVPKLLTTLRGYTREQFSRDLLAGAIVGIVALPLAIAFAIASGVSPERGLYTAIVAGFLISALGGSRVQIGGPTGAFVVIVSGIVAQYGIDGLVLATLMAGFIIVAFGLLRWGAAIKFIPYPVTIALLAAIESLLSAVVADGMIGGRHRSNMELVAQGIANIASPLFGGMPATGAIARTATNVKNGGRTPVAGMTHALTLLLITLFFGRWAGLIPLATLAAILVVVAFHMSDGRTFVSEFRAPKSDVAVLLATFLLTVLVDLTAAIEVGMVLAAFLFMRRMAEVTNISVLTHEFTDPVDDFEHDPNAIRRRVIPEGVQVYEITGPFFFGAAEMFKDRVARIAGKPKVLILRLRHVPAIDSTGLHALRELVQRSKNEGILVILSDVHAQPVVALERSGLYDELSEENIHGNIDDALNRAREALGLPLVPRPEFAIPTVARESQEHVAPPR